MESLQIKEYMNHYPVTFTVEMSVEEASLRFLKTKQIGGPVIDENHQLVGFLSESDARGYLQERSDLSENVKIFLSTFRCEDVEELSIGSEISDNMLTEVNFKTFNSFEQACDFICNYRQEFDKKLEKLNIKYNVSCTEVKDAKNEGFIISLEQVEANEDSPHRMANK